MIFDPIDTLFENAAMNEIVARSGTAPNDDQGENGLFGAIMRFDAIMPASHTVPEDDIFGADDFLSEIE